VIEGLRARLDAQEAQLREALLNEEIQKLQQKFRENEAALARSHQRAANAAGAARSAPPAVYSANQSVNKAPILREIVEYPAQLSHSSGARPRVVQPTRNTPRQRVDTVRPRVDNPRPIVPRPTPPPTRPAAAGEFLIDGLNAESHAYISTLINDNNTIAVNDRSFNIDVNHRDYANSNAKVDSMTCAPAQPQPRRRPAEAIKSGIVVQHVEKVKRTLDWAHAALPNDYSTQNTTAFCDLDFRRLIAGEMEIILEYEPSQVEIKGRLNLIRTMAKLLGAYPWSAVRNVYASVLREIEQGKLDWSSDINTTMHFSLITCPGRTAAPQSSEVRGERHGRNPTGKRGGSGNGSGESRVWFCAEYQKNQCSHKEAHQQVLYGKQVMVQHICAKCLLKDRRELKHPDSSSACPHFTE